MNFKNAVRATVGLAAAYMPGLQALRPLDRRRIEVPASRCLCGSVNLDTALRTGTHANEHVWDYAVCYESSMEKVHWVEVHPASDHGVTDLLAKFDWLKAWLASDGHPLSSFPSVFVWISSGRTTFTKSAPAARRLAGRGVIVVGSRYLIR